MADRDDPRPPSETVAWNDHNVYVLGAGFSKDAGLPVVDEFFDKTRDSVQWLKDNGYAREADSVQRVLDFRLQAASAALRVELDVENIEHLFSLVAAQAGSNNPLMNDVTLAIAATLEFARKNGPRRAAVIPSGNELLPHWQNTQRGLFTIPEYDAMIGVMVGYWGEKSWDTRNTILNFNYDLVVEEALRTLGTSFNYGISNSSIHVNDSGHDEKSELSLLKLHGSINWSICPHQVDDNIIRLEPSVDLYQDFDGLRRGGLEFLGLRPLLIPPTWRKSAFGALSQVWEKAVKALASATRIIIVGYSMPIIDQHFKYLLAAGLQRNISLRNIIIINPALHPDSGDQREALVARIFDVFKRDMQKRGRIDLDHSSAAAAFFNPDSRRKLNRHLPKAVDIQGITLLAE